MIDALAGLALIVSIALTFAWVITQSQRSAARNLRAFNDYHRLAKALNEISDLAAGSPDNPLSPLIQQITIRALTGPAATKEK